MSELNPGTHIHNRRNLRAGYSIKTIAKTEPSVDEAVEEFMSKIGEVASRGDVVDFRKWFLYFAFDVIGRVTFSKTFGLLQEGRDIKHSILIGELLERYLGVAGHMRGLHNLLTANPFMDWAGMQPWNHLDMMEEWIHFYRNHPERMNLQEVLGAGLVNLGAGPGSIGAAFQAFTYNLGAHPEKQKKLQLELDAAASNGETSWEQTQKLEYLRACIKETLRWHTTFNWGLQRTAPPGGLNIGSRNFTEGTNLSVFPWVVHHDEAIWGPDVWDWVPERWLKSGIELQRYWIPFGRGYQQCPGQKLVYFEMTKLMPRLIRAYEIELVTTKWSYSGNFLALPKECKVKLHPRSESGS